MLNDMKMKILKKSIMGLALMSMAVSCGERKDYRNVDVQERIQEVYCDKYHWCLLPFCSFDHVNYLAEYVVTLRDGNVIREDKLEKIVIAAADAKDFKIADFFFSKVRSEAVNRSAQFIDGYQTCLSVYLQCKVSTLLEEGSLEAKDQIVLFLNDYEVVHLTDANYINNVCDNVLARSIRVGDRALAERIIRCYRQDAEVKVDKHGYKVNKPGGGYGEYEYVLSWKSKEGAKKALAEAIKNGDL